MRSRLYKNQKMMGVKISIIITFLLLSSMVVVGGFPKQTQNQLMNNHNETFEKFDKQQLPTNVELHYYDGDTPDTFWGGYAPGTIWHAAIRFTPLELYEYSDWWLTSVRFFHGVGSFQPYEDHDVTVYVYDQGTIHEPGQILTSEYFVADTVGWITIPLTEPIRIDGTKDLWISFKTTQGEVCFNYFGIGSMPGEDRRSMWIYHFGEWKQLTDLNPGWSFDWFIGAFISEETSGTTELEISDIYGLFGNNAIINNIGNNDATNIEWTITINGGFLNRISTIKSGIIENLESGSEGIISSDLLFGLGPINIEIAVEAENAEPVSKTSSRFICGPLIFNGPSI